MNRRVQGKICRKISYVSKKAARRALKNFARAQGAVRFYRCGYHGGEEIYHLTSKELG